jgi:DNA-binding SARP family transcriptional activator/TolB-like protein
MCATTIAWCRQPAVPLHFTRRKTLHAMVLALVRQLAGLQYCAVPSRRISAKTPPFTLRLLGGATLLDAEQRPVQGRAVHRHRLALLALLGRAHPAAVSRDRLIGLLWPERDSAGARHLLRQAIHEIRQQLGPDAIGGIGDDVWLGESRLAVDVLEFEAAMAAGELERAVGVYRGPFLDGFFVDEAQALDEWISAQRAALTGQFEAALEKLARSSKSRDDVSEAARWRRILATAKPSDSRVAAELIDALDATNDRAAALAAALDHAAYLEREIGVKPNAEIRGRITRLSSAPDSMHRASPGIASVDSAKLGTSESEASPAAATPQPASPRPALEVREVPGEVSKEAPADAVPVWGLKPPIPVVRKRRPGLLIGVIAAAVVALGALARWLAPAAANDTRSVDVVAVLPFTYQGNGDLAYLGLGLPRLLTANLNGAGQLRTIDPTAITRSTRVDTPGNDAGAQRIALDVANRFGAGLLVTGDVVQSGDRVRITAHVSRVTANDRQNAPVDIVVDGTRERLFELVDELSGRIVAAWGTERGARLTNLAARTTNSLPALRAYLEGEREYSAARYSAAVDAFQRAVAADTAFALAYYRLSSALTWTSDPRTLPVTAQARKYISRLSQRDSLLVEARFANSSGEPVRAERLYERLLADYPDELEGWLQIAEVQYHWSATLGRPLRLAGESFARALSLDSASLPPYVHLARIVAADRDTAQLARLVGHIIPRTQGTSEAADAQALRAFVSGTRAEIASASSALITLHGDNVLRALQGIAAVTENLEASLDVARQLAERDRGTDRGASADLVVAQIEAARGRWTAAKVALDRVESRMPDVAAEYRAAFAGAIFQRLATQELKDARVAASRAGGLPFNFPLGNTPDSTRAEWLLGPRRAYLTARLAMRAGDSTAAISELRVPANATPAERSTFERANRLMLAEQSWMEGDARRGLAFLGEAPPQLDSLLPRFASYAVADERFARASMLAAIRSDSAAFRWLETFPDASGYDLIYLAPAHLARAELHEKRGERAAAAAEYRRFIALWKDCDPALRPVLDAARRQLDTLK